jgi:hypothetical protein
LGLVPDEGAVQELAAASADPAFGDRVHAGRLDVAEHGPDPGVGEDGAGRLLEWLVVEGHGYLFGGAGGERELECAAGVGEGDTFADQPGEARLVFRDLRGWPRRSR